jgi:hypothetical protein
MCCGRILGVGGIGLISAWYGLLTNRWLFLGMRRVGAEHGVFFEGKYIKQIKTHWDF